MFKAGIDQSALIDQFSQATAKQGEALRKAVHQATLKALQGRELTLKNIKQVVKTVGEAASMGAAKNPMAGADIEPLLEKAVAGIDAALLQAVEANRRALQQLVDQGATVRDTQIKKALGELERMEDMMFETLGKAAAGAAEPLKGPWSHVLDSLKQGGSDTGARATATVEQMAASAKQVLREGRAVGMAAAQALLDSYAALASGVLIGMSEGLKGGTGGKAGSAGGADADDAAPAAAKRARRK